MLIAVQGVTKQQVRWQKCVEFVNERLGMAVGRLFIRENFQKESKESVTFAWQRPKRAERDIGTSVLFVRLSVTVMFCAKTAKHIVEILSLSSSLISLVFSEPNASRNSNAVTYTAPSNTGEDTIRYDTIEEFNVDSKTGYTA